MAEITAALVKAVRDATNAGMMQCRKALVESDGTVDGAIDWLRKQGVKATKTERSTEEGAIALKVEGKTAAIVELQCETDFAARNEKFLALCDSVLSAGLKSKAGCNDGLLAAPANDGSDGGTVDQLIKFSINTIGENIRLKRYSLQSLDGAGAIGSYVHATTGKLGVLVGVKAGKAESEGSEVMEGLVKQLAMHIAGAPIPPLALRREEIDSTLVEQERSVIRAAMENDPKDSKKPDNIKEKIIDGKMSRFFAERVLPEQAFVMDDKQSIQDVVKAAGKELGDTLEIVWFARWELGGR